MCACSYCGLNVPNTTAPATDDDRGWSEIAARHAPDCEWVLTRAHRRIEGPAPGADSGARDRSIRLSSPIGNAPVRAKDAATAPVRQSDNPKDWDWKDDE